MPEGVPGEFRNEIPDCAYVIAEAILGELFTFPTSFRP